MENTSYVYCVCDIIKCMYFMMSVRYIYIYMRRDQLLMSKFYIGFSEYTCKIKYNKCVVLEQKRKLLVRDKKRDIIY